MRINGRAILGIENVESKKHFLLKKTSKFHASVGCMGQPQTTSKVRIHIAVSETHSATTQPMLFKDISKLNIEQINAPAIALFSLKMCRQQLHTVSLHSSDLLEWVGPGPVRFLTIDKSS